MADLSLDPTQLDRYSRHIIMDEIGPEGQAKLLGSRVLVIGAGGLGAPIIQYLAAAGIGTLGIADDDSVERSNLQRQIIHGDADVGEPKVESARRYVERLNPDITVETHEIRVEPDNVEKLIGDYDVVVDGSDNFRTRYLVNDACTLSNTPFSHGAIYKFEGQAITFPAGEGEDRGPCYRCLFPEAPPEDAVANCATTGVLGVLPGTLGCIQATEAMKLVLDFGEPLEGRLLVYDAADMTFEEVPVRRNPDCPVCGEDSIDSIESVEYAAEGCRVSAD